MVKPTDLDMMWMDTPGFYMLSQLMMSSKSTMRSEDCLLSSETGLNWGTDLRRIKKRQKICCTKGSQEHRGLHPSERFGRAMTQSWLSIQGGKRIFVRDVTRKPMVDLDELQRACVQMVEGSRRFAVAAIKPWLMECCTVVWQKRLLKKSWQRNTQRTLKLWEPGLLGLMRQNLIFVASILMITFGKKSKTASSAAQQHPFDEARWWQH